MQFDVHDDRQVGEIRDAALIVLDEAPLMNRYSVEAVDRPLRDIMRVSDPYTAFIPFGGKIVVFGGDFRQVLPVIRKGTRSDTIDIAISLSSLWPLIHNMRLTINMRLQNVQGNDIHAMQQRSFASFCLAIGDGRTHTLPGQEHSTFAGTYPSSYGPCPPRTFITLSLPYTRIWRTLPWRTWYGSLAMHLSAHE